jgi:D-alanyl-D-alanine carboxypeptidase/D-alanyl-D-alanine-endopeptidase (penicillin-binding protein 4)
VTEVRRGRSPASAIEVGRVESATVGDLVQRMLTESDDELAESLGHLVGGQALGQPTFAGGAKATVAALAALGLDTHGLTLADASGLSRRNRIPVRVLGDVLGDVVVGAHPVLGSIAPGLAVAGLTGTLADRFASAATRPGRGFVHAKTGTLTGVVGLAGTVLDADGRVLVFAMLDDDVRSIPSTRETIDVIASRLAGCGCSG